MLNVKQIKKDFPIFTTHPDLVYLDSTATALKPRSVIEKVSEYYKEYSANIFRGVYDISERATREYEETREEVARFINAKHAREIVFTRNTTESLNLLAYTIGREVLQKDSEVIVSVMEHHSNFVPWQQLAFENNAVFKVLNVNDDGYFDFGDINQEVHARNMGSIVTKNSKILTLTLVSNVLGTINPIKQIIAAAKLINPSIITIVDAAQAAPHIKIDVQDLGCDFLAFSSHKMLGPTGVGVLWGRARLLEAMAPFQYGGEMIADVRIEESTFNEIPYKFEAGTPHIDGVVALKEAIRYIETIGFEAISAHEHELTRYAISQLRLTFKDKINYLGPEEVIHKGAIIAFGFGTYHPHDIAQILNSNHIAVRAGHHCAMPLHERYGLTATTRASFYIYNDISDVDKLILGLKNVEKILKA